MSITTRFLTTLSLLLLTGFALSQEHSAQKIQLPAPTIDEIASIAVWRTDY